MSDPATASGILIIKIGIMSILSGIAGALSRYKHGTDHGIIDTLIIAFVHSLSGMTIALMAKTMSDNEYFILAVAGMGGFIGTKAMISIFRRVIDNSLNIK